MLSPPEKRCRVDGVERVPVVHTNMTPAEVNIELCTLKAELRTAMNFALELQRKHNALVEEAVGGFKSVEERFEA